MFSPSRSQLCLMAVIYLFLLAGCSSLAENRQDRSTPTPTETPELTNATEPTEPATETETAASAVNPWGERIVTVRLASNPTVENLTRHRSALRGAIQWHNNAGPAEYEIQLAFTTDESADVTIELSDTISRCFDERATETFYWCSPQHNVGENAPTTDTVEIATRYEQPATRTFYREALGYLTGTDQPNERDDIQRPQTIAVRDPWPARDTVVVNISDAPASDSPQRVRRALEYWSTGEGVQYRNYSQKFVLRPHADQAAVTVNYTSDIGRCGFTIQSDTGGCAPVLSGDRYVSDHSEIRISTGYVAESREKILIHEFGHLFGRLHGQPPSPVMNATTDLTETAAPNAATRDQPWRFDLLRVYLDRQAVENRDADTAERELGDSFGAVENDVAGIPDGVIFERVDERDQADISITVGELDGDITSNATLYGEDSDNDAALEEYTELTITIGADTPAEDYGYHMAYWVIGSFVERRPDHIDADGDDDREDWEDNR